MKKIAVVIKDLSTKGGVQYISAKLINELAKNDNFQITLVSLFSAKDSIAIELNPKIITKIVFKEPPFSMRTYPIKTILGLKHFFGENKFDLLITSTIASFLYLVLPKSTKKIFWIHQGFFLSKIFGIGWFDRRIAAKYFDAVVTLLDETKNDFINKINCSARIVTIENSISEIHPDFEYNPDSKSILSVGRLSFQKGFDLLIDVAKIVLSKHSDWVWHVGGDGDCMQSLLKKRDRLGLKGKLFFDGIPNDIVDYYKDRAMYVMTSRYEGMPLVLLEARRAKLPCISFNCKTGPSSIISDGFNGYLINPFDVESMAAHICCLIENKNKRLKFSKNSQIGFDRYSDKKFLGKWNRLISELIEM